MVRCSLALALILGFTMTALADLAPPPPGAGFKRVPQEHVLKLAKELDDYEFYPFERLGPGGKHVIGDRLKVSTKEGVPVRSSQSASVRTGVIAVPVKVLKEFGSPGKLSEILGYENEKKLPAGVVVHDTYGTHEDIAKRDTRTKVVTVITVSRDEKAGVRFTEAQQGPASGAAPAANKSSDSSPRPPLGTVIAGVILSLAIASVGLIFLRRKS